MCIILTFTTQWNTFATLQLTVVPTHIFRYTRFNFILFFFFFYFLLLSFCFCFFLPQLRFSISNQFQNSHRKSRYGTDFGLRFTLLFRFVMKKFIPANEEKRKTAYETERTQMRRPKTNKRTSTIKWWLFILHFCFWGASDLKWWKFFGRKHRTGRSFDGYRRLRKTIGTHIYRN